ncbi:serine/threonine protein kinase [Corallococcus coralloides DSM 2259]|uniref:Serine/threonine protein kinase n=1 Tax=Corallococcus coralloides (strain ATCC 25202 / DSM 2259 / NBRC 100086 / M2) TaxID=1144275 RepID=H8MYH4_CORCM|nr:serine/threonine-protein kinase [Corallococcus coralloides]AFE09353.1 serine/threonine protein kinase [Corallococcus coralloides DSM 2259]
MDLQAGDVFGRYELVSWLGRGGMAETWHAQLVGDAGVTKPVLIKKVLPEYANDEAFISMFISEARISATLSHGNVAQVFDFGRVEGEYFLAMEFVDGQPLHRVLKRALRSDLGRMPIPIAVFIAMEMCRGLHYAHTRTDGSGRPLGIVHRDISPDNVLLGYEGQVKIVDFGIAKAQLIRGISTEPGVVKGKFHFFSPEQARGEGVDARTDVWSTGVVLYELLCGKLPVEGPPAVVLSRVGNGEIPSPATLRPDLPKELNDIVMKALTPDRQRRFDSSHAFGDALTAFLYANFPRFSSMSLAHLLRVLFKEDLAQLGREPSVPGSFLEDLKAWSKPAAPARPVTPPAPPPVLQRQPRPVRPSNPTATAMPAPRVPAPAPAPPKPLRTGLGVGALLAVAAGLVFLWRHQTATQPVEEPPPQPMATLEPPSEPAPTPVAEVAPPPAAPSNEIMELRQQIQALVDEKNYDVALVKAQLCIKLDPTFPDCERYLGFLYAELGDATLSEEHYKAYVKLAAEGDPARARVMEGLGKSGDAG